jgi:hypothetical protein
MEVCALAPVRLCVRHVAPLAVGSEPVGRLRGGAGRGAGGTAPELGRPRGDGAGTQVEHLKVAARSR